MDVAAVATKFKELEKKNEDMTVENMQLRVKVAELEEELATLRRESAESAKKMEVRCLGAFISAALMLILGSCRCFEQSLS